MKYLPLNPEIFVKNRQRFIKEMKPDSIAIFVSNDEVPVNGDALYPFKQKQRLVLAERNSSGGYYGDPVSG
jgi:Xaa-Pro aminopeptidase